MTITEDYQVEFNGVMIADGETRTILNMSVFESPVIRSNDQNRGQQDGLFPGVDLYGEKTITMELELWGTSLTEFYDAYRQVQDACVKGSEKALEFRIPGWPDNLISYARCRKVSGLIVDQAFELHTARCVLQFVSTDPRLYAATLQSGIAQLAVAQPGRTYDLTFNRNYGGVVSSNAVNATNDGNYDAPWTAHINGPVTDPSIENSDLGKTISLTGEVADGDFLIIQSAPYQTIMLGGTATRYSWLDSSSNWFLLQPGVNQIRFSGTSAGTPTMDFSWRSAWAV